jgi:hypothetical protein
VDEIRRVVDPDGREVVFDHGTWLHLAERRPWLLDYIDAVLAAIALPYHREPDPLAGRERFYTRRLLLPEPWLCVIVDYTEVPAAVVTAFVDDDDPREHHR